MRAITYVVTMHHGKVVSWHGPGAEFGNVEIFVPAIGTKVGPVIQEEKSVTRGIRIRTRVGWEVAHAVLAPNGHDVRAFVGGDGLRRVIAEGIDRSREMREQPVGNLFARRIFAIPKEPDGSKPGVQRSRERLDNDGARGVDKDQVIDALANLCELIDNLETDDTTSRPTPNMVGPLRLATFHLLNKLDSHPIHAAIEFLGGFHEGREESPNGPVRRDLANLGVRGRATATIGNQEELFGSSPRTTLQKSR